MNNYRKNLQPSYYNILILSLILVILFSMVRLKSNKENIHGINSQTQHSVVFNPDGEKKDSNFLIRTIQHMFPNRKVEKQYEPMFSFKEIYASFFKSIFRIDFKNPLTFVQAQFPVAVLHNQTLMASIPQGDQEEGPEDDWSREIHFVDYNGEAKTTVVNKNMDEYLNMEEDSLDEDDLGEIREGVYSIGEDHIVDSLDFSNSIDLESIPKPAPIKIEKDQPLILIYHTHGTESYKPATEGNYHTLRKEYTVIEAASVMKDELEKRGYKVIHDGTYHDYPSYNGSYGRSVVTARSILEKNPSIKVVLDIHRDGYDKIDTRQDRLRLIENSRIKINNEYVARFQFVIGATTENRKEVEGFAHFVKAVSDSKYPGFSKDVLVKQYGKYNQFLSDKAALIELGSNANTIEEAKRAAYYLADVLAEALKLLEE